MDRREELGTLPINKLLVKFSVPAIIGMMVNGLYNVVDRIFIGNIPGIGGLAITGVGITIPITTIILAFAMLVGIGTTSLISLRMGEGKKDEAEHLLGNCFTLSFLVSVILTIIGLIFVDPILESFGASPQTIGYARTYITIILIGTIFSVASFAVNATIRSDGNPRFSATTMVFSCILNIILDYVFLFVFDWGIIGAAIATVFSQMVSTLLMLWYYTLGKSFLKLKWHNMKLKPSLVKGIFAIGASAFIMQICASMVQVFSNNALRTYGGDLAIGAMTVINSVNLVFLMPVFGLNQGCQPIIGFNYGAGNFNRSKKTLALGTIVGVCIASIGAIVIQCFPQFVINLFNSDPDLVEIGIKGLRIAALMIAFVPVAVIGGGYFQSIGKAKISFFLSILRQGLLLIPFMLFFPMFFGLDGVWWALAVSDILSIAITLMIVIYSVKDKVNNIS